MAKKFESVTFKSLPGRTGIMTPIELKDYIDFEVKRVYYVTKPTGDTGQHCHYKEKEFFILVQGKATAVIDRGKGKEEFPMEGPNSAIYVPNYVWHGFTDLSEDAILLAITSTNYIPDRSDYLEDYEKYLTLRDDHLGKE
jgi:mannose-6-phosphate isomerase-like protein (cupin superfamily)